MRKYTDEEIATIIEKHKKWIAGSDDGEIADLSGAYLRGADLRGADLRGADLSGAYLSDADLSNAYLSDADLSGADLRDADLIGAKNVPFIPMVCPDSGSFTAWKRCGSYIVKLLIPEDAERSSATGRKCRCSKAIALEIQSEEGTDAGITSVVSLHGGVYTIGDTVEPDFWDRNRWLECSHGIHFFVNRQEAVDYTP